MGMTTEQKYRAEQEREAELARERRDMARGSK